MPFPSWANHKPVCAGPEVLIQPVHEQSRYKEASRAIFDSKEPFPLTMPIQRIMTAWFNDPYTTIIADFEYDVQLLPTLSHEAIFQIAVANALGEWIVPPSSINHCMSTLEYFKKLKLCSQQHRRGNNTYHGLLWKGQFAMHYGNVDEIPTRGISWNEIGDMVDSYTKVSEPTSLSYTANMPLETRELADFP